MLREWPQADVLEVPTLGRGLALAQARRPDLVVLDLSLPDASGLAGISRALKSLNGVPMMTLCHEAGRAEAAVLLAMGVCGYLPKDKLAGELIEATRRLLAGGRFVTASLASRFLSLPPVIARSPGS